MENVICFKKMLTILQKTMGCTMVDRQFFTIDQVFQT
jgi:hypothetical protein